ncbi:hypothetical protein EUAN_02530 [Andreesenia angusta]|uniref:Uncharacterized protein n=1 Tax=Andreesenia angusta TaxID=39480 RepID=A0A1S1VC62_9FIRM|nr:hypothetical protein EUAN_02530 [Andreesenia angusta]
MRHLPKRVGAFVLNESTLTSLENLKAREIKNIMIGNI